MRDTQVKVLSKEAAEEFVRRLNEKKVLYTGSDGIYGLYKIYTEPVTTMSQVFVNVNSGQVTYCFYVIPDELEHRIELITPFRRYM